jgi:DNA replication protein DnaC
MIKVPKRFEEARLYDWEDSNPLKQVSKEYIEAFGTFFEQGVAPSFFGTSGGGKTRVSCAILNTVSHFSKPKVGVAWFPVSEAINRMLDYRDMRSKDGYTTIWETMTETDLVVFDDISTIRNSPRVMEYFWMIIESRYSNLRSTIYTGNFEETKDSTVWDAISNQFSPALSRRIQETSGNLAMLI